MEKRPTSKQKRIRISSELSQRLDAFAKSANSPFSKTKAAIEYSIQQFLLETRSMVELGDPYLAVDGSGVIMFDPKLNKDVIVLVSEDGELYCPYHQFTHTYCSHILKANIANATKELQAERGLSYVPWAPNLLKSKSGRKDTHIDIDIELYEKCRLWFLKNKNNFGFDTISDLIEHSIIVTLHREIGYV